jgi:hypothetical protein
MSEDARRTMTTKMTMKMKMLTMIAVTMSAATAHAATDRVALLQLDAYYMDARNETRVVREAADRVTRTAKLDEDPSFAALSRAVAELSQQVAAIKRAPGPLPQELNGVAEAVVDVERDARAVRSSAMAHDARGVREDCDYVLQALERVDWALDRVFNLARLERINVQRTLPTPRP